MCASPHHRAGHVSRGHHAARSPESSGAKRDGREGGEALVALDPMGGGEGVEDMHQRSRWEERTGRDQQPWWEKEGRGWDRQLRLENEGVLQPAAQLEKERVGTGGDCGDFFRWRGE